jgi:hypothetical protein
MLPDRQSNSLLLGRKADDEGATAQRLETASLSGKMRKIRRASEAADPVWC